MLAARWRIRPASAWASAAGSIGWLTTASALDQVAKGAWAGLFGGPAYLLVATSAGWVLPGWATFGAVAAFVGGFAVLVIRMGDKPSRGSGPDNGAVL